MKKLNILEIIKTIQKNKDIIKPKYIGFEVYLDKEFGMNILEIYIPTEILKLDLEREEKIKELFKADKCIYIEKIGKLDPFWAISWRFRGKIK